MNRKRVWEIGAGGEGMRTMERWRIGWSLMMLMLISNGATAVYREFIGPVSERFLIDMVALAVGIIGMVLWLRDYKGWKDWVSGSAAPAESPARPWWQFWQR